MDRFDAWTADLSPPGWTILVAVVMGLGGLVTATFVVTGYWRTALFDLSGPYGVRTHVVTVSAGLSAFTLGGFLWWIIVESTGDVHWSNGARVGALTVIISHLITLLAFLLVEWFPAVVTDLSIRLFVDLFVSASFYGLLSVLGFGLITIPVGAVLGLVLVRLRSA